jgi:hypothetical protein
MATISESVESTGTRQNFTGDALETRREFDVIFSDAEVTAGTNIDIVAQALVGVPLGSPHPTVAGAFCETIEVKKVSGSQNVFRVVCIYKGNSFTPSGGGDVNQSFTLTAKAVPKLVYRVDPSVPQEGTPNDNDIGGTAIDINGKPTSVVTVQSNVSVTMSLNIDVTSPNNYIEGIQSLVGTRNSVNFLGASKGNLLYTGATVNKVSGVGAAALFKITHSFAFDDQAHMVQVAESTDVRPSGVQLGKDVGNATYEKNAFKVKLQQPFTETGNFNSLGINVG